MAYQQVEARYVDFFSKKEVGDDIHIVKEVLVEDGKKVSSNIRVIKDYQRPFWITKPIYQNYKDKKEYEELSRVDMFKSTQSDLFQNVAKRLGGRYIGVKDPRIIRDSPYVYGLDIESRTFLKYKYDSKLQQPMTPYNVGFFDIEVDTITNDIIIISFITHDVLKVAILDSFIKGTDVNKKRLLNMYNTYIPEDNNGLKDHVDLEIKFFPTEVDMIKYIFHEANYANIDVLAAWNIKYDLTEIIERLEKNGIDPADVFHYDAIPRKYKFFKFKEGRAKRVTEAGREITFSPEDIWHNIKCTANYMFLDAMASYNYIRIGSASVPGGYSLDNILKLEGITGKLKFEDNDEPKFKGIEWHINMVKNKPFEYVIYNIWDTMSLMTMEMKTKDLSVSLPLLSGPTHFSNFNSGPRKIVDSMFFFYLKHGKVMGTASPTKENDKILGLDGWVVTLISHLMEDNDTKHVAINGEETGIRHNVRRQIFDLDAVSSYPSNTVAANVSTATTHREIVKIGDMDKKIFKIVNIDLMYGPTNAIEYCQTMFGMPSIFDILKNT